MNNKIVVRPTFQKQARKLAKRYRSLPDDLALLFDELRANALLGTSLGGNVRKIRLAIKSKAKGKSGGARIITYVYFKAQTVYLLSIYDKSETENISDEELKLLVKELSKSEFDKGND